MGFNSAFKGLKVQISNVQEVVISEVSLPDFQDNMLLTVFTDFFSGVLKNVQDDFHIGNDLGGLLQTAFVLSYMIFAPLFGYLGDRYSRRWIMAFGVLLWSLTTLLGSFMQVSCAYELLVLHTV